MEDNKVVTEVVENLETVREIGPLGTGLILAGSMVVGAIAYNKVLKPVGKFLMAKVAAIKEARKDKKIDVAGTVE